MDIACYYCRKSFNNDDTEICCTPCGHTFHKDCIFSWMDTQEECPKCWDKISTTSVFKLYLSASAPSKTSEDLKTYQQKCVEIVKSNESLVVQRKHLQLFYTDRTSKNIKMQLKFQNRFDEYNGSCEKLMKGMTRLVSILEKEYKHAELKLTCIWEKVRRLKVQHEEFAEFVKNMNGLLEILRCYLEGAQLQKVGCNVKNQYFTLAWKVKDIKFYCKLVLVLFVIFILLLRIFL